MITSVDYIEINGISSETAGIYIDTPLMPPKAQKKTQTIVIPGRENTIVSNGEYEDIQYIVTAYVFERDYDPGTVYHWIETARTLRTSLSADWYLKVKKVLGVTPNYAGNGKYRLDLSFVCSPFKYAVNNAIHTETAKQFKIANDGTEYSQPVYIVYGSGEISLRANNDENTITVKNVNGKVTIDCERLVCYDDNRSILRAKGLYPFLVSGNNNITVTGNVSKTEYYVNARWI